MSNQRYITCQELIEFLGDYVSGELPTSSRTEVDRHLGVCPSCVAYVEGYKRAIALGKDALKICEDETDLGPPPESLLKALREARAKSRP